MNYRPLIILAVVYLIYCYESYERATDYYTIPKLEYNELTQDGKVWAYVRKDGKL